MKIIKQPRTIISNPDSIFGYFAWPTVARLPDGSLATVCSGFRMRHVCPFGKAVISFSRDDGETWSRPAPVIDTPLDDRDAGICVYGNNIIVTSFNNTPDFQRRRAEINISKGDNGTSMRFIQGYFGMYPEDAVEKYFGSTYKISRDGGVTFEEMKRSPVTTPPPKRISRSRSRASATAKKRSNILSSTKNTTTSFSAPTKRAPRLSERRSKHSRTRRILSGLRNKRRIV